MEQEKIKVLKNINDYKETAEAISLGPLIYYTTTPLNTQHFRSSVLPTQKFDQVLI